MLCLIFAFFFSYFESALADTGDKTIHHGTYTGFKERFPDSDGIVWSESFLKVIFEQAGYTLDVKEFPAKRLPLVLQDETIDSFVSTRESLENNFNFLESKFPTTTLAYIIYYRKDGDWVPTWPPDATLAGKNGRSKTLPLSLVQEHKLKLDLLPTFDACIKMVNAGRVDYWLDNISGLANATPGLLQRSEEFRFKRLFGLGLYMYFPNTERGKQLRDIYDAGIAEILKQGEFVNIYYQYDSRTRDLRAANETIKFIRDLYPDMLIPEQTQPRR